MSGMRKKRKLQARADAEAEHAVDMETPELVEALEAEKLAEGMDEDPESLEDKAERRRSMKKILESLLFASDKPLTVQRLKQLTREKESAPVEDALAALQADYDGRGIVLHQVAGGWQMRTAPDTAEWVQQLIAGRPVRLSRAQLETLAIIAYRQPVTRPEIDEIRGVDSGGTLKLLLDRSLVRVLGKKEEPGRPLLYGTTRDFLEFFNLSALKDLPTLREYHELTEDSIRKVEETLGVTAEEAEAAAREHIDQTASVADAASGESAVEPGDDGEAEVEAAVAGGDAGAEADPAAPDAAEAEAEADAEVEAEAEADATGPEAEAEAIGPAADATGPEAEADPEADVAEAEVEPPAEAAS